VDIDQLFTTDPLDKLIVQALDELSVPNAAQLINPAEPLLVVFGAVGGEQPLTKRW
jgi:hypothetical protein